MTTAQTGAPEYDGRIRRAERLATQHAFAAEFLNFYKHVAAFQKTLRASIAASSGAKSRGALSAELRIRSTSRPASPLPRLSFHHEQHAPPALRKPRMKWRCFRQIPGLQASKPTGRHAGKYDQQSRSVRAVPCPSVFWQPYAEFRAALTPQAPMVITVRVCPLCGSRPLMGVLRVEGDSGSGSCSVPFCSRNGNFAGFIAPRAANRPKASYRLCCGTIAPHSRRSLRYLQVLSPNRRSNKRRHAIPLVDDLAAIPLTLWGPRARLLPPPAQSPGNIAGMRFVAESDMVRYCGTSMLEMNKPRTLGLLCASMFLCACVDHTKQTEARMKSESTQKITGSPSRSRAATRSASSH